MRTLCLAPSSLYTFVACVLVHALCSWFRRRRLITPIGAPHTTCLYILPVLYWAQPICAYNRCIGIDPKYHSYTRTCGPFYTNWATTQSLPTTMLVTALDPTLCWGTTPLILTALYRTTLLYLACRLIITACRSSRLLHPYIPPPCRIHGTRLSKPLPALRDLLQMRTNLTAHLVQHANRSKFIPCNTFTCATTAVCCSSPHSSNV
jgi:hypothetical protein